MRNILAILLIVSISCSGQNLLYSELIPVTEREQFTRQVIISADRLHVNPNWLMIVMAFETARTFRPNVVNKYSGATGLIQFIPTTAKHLGTTTYKLKKMNRVEQMLYVEKYFIPYAGKMQDEYDVYVAVFAPAFLGQPLRTVLYRQNSPTLLGRQRYNWNKVLDSNKDGVITIRDVKRQIKSFVPKNYNERRGIE